MNRSDTRLAIEETEDGEICEDILGSHEEVIDSKKKRKGKTFPLIVSNIPSGVTRGDLEKIFSQYGEVTSASLLIPNDYGVREGDVCIVMKGIESGRKILKELNKKAIFDAHPTHEVSIKFFDEDVYNPTKLYVSHIPAECTEDDVSRVFCRFGAIRKVFLLKFADGTSKGCGFVEYTSNENAKAAIVNLHHKYKMNNSAYSLVVKFSGQAALQPREIDSNYSCNRSEDTASRGLAASKKKKTPRHPEIEYAQEVPQTTPYASPEQIAAYYQQYYAYISNMHPAMQTMQTPQNMYSMQANIQTPTTNNSASTSEAAGVSGRAFQRGPKPECNLYVGNVPLTYTEEDLGAMFRPFGRVISAVLGADPKTKLSKGYGFVSFEEANSASLAIQQTNGLVIGGKKLKVSVKK